MIRLKECGGVYKGTMLGTVLISVQRQDLYRFMMWVKSSKLTLEFV